MKVKVHNPNPKTSRRVKEAPLSVRSLASSVSKRGNHALSQIKDLISPMSKFPRTSNKQRTNDHEIPHSKKKGFFQYEM